MTACLAGLTATASADTYNLFGTSSDYRTPLSATVQFNVISANEMTVAVTNTASDAGPDNRITYFGIQLPDDKIRVDLNESETDGSWAVENNGKLPGKGANRFDLLAKVTSPSHGNGLHLGDTLTMTFYSVEGSFDPLNVNDWERTSKNSYLMAAKFQSVGGGGEDSGVATDFTPQSVPEPASAALLIMGGLMVCGRRRRTRPTTA